MMHTAGIDVGSSVVKAVVVASELEGPRIISRVSSRIRKRDVTDVVDQVFSDCVAKAGLPELQYIATTGEGEDIPFATGHFYGMTTHARGALFLDPACSAVLDVGALHARAIAMDPRGKVTGYKMTSQCASGSGQFLENIARYLGVSHAEIGELSLQSTSPEPVSSICAVLAETDVINMVSRGVSTPDILRGIHESMGGRYLRLLRALNLEGTTFISGGLAADEGLLAATSDLLRRDPRNENLPITLSAHPLSIFAGAIGAAIWGAFRAERLGLQQSAWRA